MAAQLAIFPFIIAMEPEQKKKSSVWHFVVVITIASVIVNASKTKLSAFVATDRRWFELHLSKNSEGKLSKSRVFHQ